MVSRRKLLSMLAGGALAAPLLLMPRKTIFLPPIGGWLSPIAQLVIPDMLLPDYEEGIKSGKFTYFRNAPYEKTKIVKGFNREYRDTYIIDKEVTISQWWAEEVENDGKFHSPNTGKTYDFGLVDGTGSRAAIDDEGMTADLIREADKQRFAQGIGSTGFPISPPLESVEKTFQLPFDAELSAAQEASRKMASQRTADILARWG
jgi:hypothetical protein